MRTDVKIDSKGVFCRNASTFGYGKSIAKPGDIIAYREHHQDDTASTQTARVVGRIAYAPEGIERVRGHLVVLTLSSTATAVYERWINPGDVTEIRDVSATFARWFFAPSWSHDADMLRRLCDYGTLNTTFIDHLDETAGRIRQGLADAYCHNHARANADATAEQLLNPTPEALRSHFRTEYSQRITLRQAQDLVTTWLARREEAKAAEARLNTWADEQAAAGRVV